ncbi:MxcI protein [Corallococcus praedator]|uniref:MxcI protein n=1 Tax=Corallococcus praedator TaxID=2316724 RepID=A0ABX9QAX5_9BACT|nr:MULTISPECIES: MxcI protein [Corallococcus]RKH22153.1 MxcI protein [Corallococcus sp. CA031C]RKH97349.1 MxcI protein [Corallococcus praedator]
MKHPVAFPSLRRSAAMLTLALFTGCGDSEEPGTDDNRPLYAITTQLLVEDPVESYVVVTTQAEQTASLSLDNAIKVSGRALGVGIPKSGSLYVVSDESPVVTRYRLNSAGSLEQAGTVSFETRGVTSLGEYQANFQFISETKAYFFDGATAQVVIWNPTAMTVTGTIPLAALVIPDTVLAFSGAVVHVGSQLIMPVGWRPVSGVGITKKAGVVSIDTATDAATIATDDRCGYTHDAALGLDGKVYVATEAYGAAVYRVAPDAPEPCLLKFDPQTRAFDATFYRSLADLVGGGTAGALIPGAPGTAYVRVLDENIAPVTEGTHPRTMASGTGWQWWELKLDTLTATRKTDFPSTSGSVFLFESENQTLYTEFGAGAASTTLHVLGENGKPTLTTQGLSFSFVQLR